MDVCVMWCIYMFVWMCAWCGAHTCSCGCRHGVPADVCACGLWRTEVDVTCLPPLLSILFFEIGSPTQPGAQQFREHGWPIGYMNLPVSSPIPPHHHPTSRVTNIPCHAWLSHDAGIWTQHFISWTMSPVPERYNFWNVEELKHIEMHSSPCTWFKSFLTHSQSCLSVSSLPLLACNYFDMYLVSSVLT